MAEQRKTAFSGIVPHLAVKGGFEAIAFYETAFGAELVERMPAPDGRLMHAQLQINGAPLFLHDDLDGTVGVRYARLRDPFGHVWSLGAPIKHKNKNKHDDDD